jgi:hypothetical protein
MTQHFSILNKLITKPIQASNGRLFNPVIGRLGDDPDAASTGNLFLTYAIHLWRIAINIGALIVLAFYIVAAYEWLTSGSDTQGVEKARKRFVNATIGLILLVGSFAIIAFISNLLFGEDFNLLHLTFPVGQSTAPTTPIHNTGI